MIKKQDMEDEIQGLKKEVEYWKDRHSIATDIIMDLKILLDKTDLIADDLKEVVLDEEDN